MSEITSKTTIAPPPPAEPGSGGRVLLLDVARAIALLAMATYHFTWDLEYFGYVARGLTGHGGWKIFARCIASSFLFLVGFSLVLAHARAIRWRPFLIRLAQVAGGAAAITLVTSFAMPDEFIFFGILHQIALASLIGLAFIGLPAALTAMVGAAVIALPFLVETAVTDTRWLAWIGLAENPPLSNDFVPVLPWFGAVLFGIAAARLAVSRGWLAKVARLNPRLARLAVPVWFGRHSLAFYLVHQPLLFGVVWIASQVAPPDPGIRFQAACRQECLVTGDEDSCRSFCACTQDKLAGGNLLKAYLDGPLTPDDVTAIRGLAAQCVGPSP